MARSALRARLNRTVAVVIGLGGFLPIVDAALSTATESNTVTLQNLAGSVPLTVSGGSYSKNGGAYATSATTVQNGDTLKLRVTSSSSAGTAATVTATIDGQARSFTVTTAASTTPPVTPPGVSGTLPNAIIGQAYDASLTVTPSGAAVTLDSATQALIAAHNIAHNGFGRFTSASVS